MPRKTHFVLAVDPKSLRKLKQLEKKLPRAVSRGISDGTEQIATSLRAATNVFKYPRGNLRQSIVVENPSEDVFEIKMAEYGQYLNRSSDYGHFISLKPGRKITDWARRAGYGTWVKSLYVMGPDKNYEGWVDNALRNAPDTIIRNVEDQLGMYQK